MKVLLLFPMADGQTGPAIKYAFESLGHKVLAVDAKISKVSESYRYCCEFKPDLVFCSRTYQLTEDVATIKKWFKDAIICMWNVDTRNSIHEWAHLFPLIRLCDYYFVVASNLIPEWQKINANTFWLPQGVQNEVYDKPKEITDGDRKKYECDISFAGSCTDYHKWRIPYLAAIERMGLDFKIWGCRKNPKVYNEEHNKMASLSKINFTYSGWHENGKYVSVRNFKIMGAGGFLLEYKQDKVFEVMPPDVSDCYTSVEDLVEKIRYWLIHERERKEVAEKGYKWVHKNATYTHCMQKALKIMKLGG